MFRSVHPPAGYTVVHRDRYHWIVRQAEADALLALPLTDPERLAAQPGAEARPGRRTHWSVPLARGAAIVRAVWRGGLPGRLLGPWHVALGGTPRPVAELEASLAARAAGIATPPVLAAGWADGPPGLYRAWVVVAEVARSTALARLWDRRPDPAWWGPAARAAGAAVAHLHNAGFIHPDLNADNLLLEQTASGWRAWILDFDRVRPAHAVTPLARAQALWRLHRSCEKHRRAGAPIPWTAAAAFLRGYRAATTLDPRQLHHALRLMGPAMRLKARLSDALHLSRPARTHAASWITSL